MQCSNAQVCTCSWRNNPGQPFTLMLQIIAEQSQDPVQSHILLFEKLQVSTLCVWPFSVWISLPVLESQIIVLWSYEPVANISPQGAKQQHFIAPRGIVQTQKFSMLFLPVLCFNEKNWHDPLHLSSSTPKSSWIYFALPIPTCHYPDCRVRHLSPRSPVRKAQAGAQNHIQVRKNICRQGSGAL